MGVREDLHTIAAARQRLEALSGRLHDAGSWRRHMDMIPVLDSLRALETAWTEQLDGANAHADRLVLEALVGRRRRRTITELAVATGLDGQAVGRSLDRLARDGYVFGGPDTWEVTGTGARQVRDVG